MSILNNISLQFSREVKEEKGTADEIQNLITFSNINLIYKKVAGRLLPLKRTE